MKNRIYLIALVLVGCLSSCESDDTGYQNELKKSQSVLSDFKKRTDNFYEYTVVSSSWIGVTWETTIVVSDGEVIQRHFKYTNTEALENNIPQEELEWTENKSQIGNHTIGFDPITLDEVYTKAEQEWLPKRDDVKIYFETENNGLISTCGYVENGCQDDCFVGIHIKRIKALGSLL